MCFLDQRYSVLSKQLIFKKNWFINNWKSLIHNKTKAKAMNELYLK
jgi:hypothetical protein